MCKLMEANVQKPPEPSEEDRQSGWEEKQKSPTELLFFTLNREQEL